MQHALRPYATAGIALVGASMIAVAPMAPPAAVPVVKMPAVQLTATDAEAFAILIYALDPGPFSSASFTTPDSGPSFR